MTLGPGENLGPYRIVERIGRGGMASVYKAYQPSLSRHVAIKVLPDYHAEDPDFLERFQREAVVVANLRHPNILVVFDSGQQDGTTYIVSELVEGGTLADRLGEPVSLDASVSLLEPLASALDYAHSRGVIHRDVKPANVLLSEDGTPVLSDFGVARILGRSRALTGTGVGLGTPEYMAPEQAMGREVGPAADVYALAVVAYEMLTGSVPFSADTPLAVALAHIHNALPLPKQRNPSLPDGAQDVLLKGLAKNPEDRYATAGDMIRALAEAARFGTAPVPPASAPVATGLGAAVTSPAATGLPAASAARAKKALPLRPPLLIAAAVLATLVVAATIALGNGRPNRSSATDAQEAVGPGAASAPLAACLAAGAILESADAALREGATARAKDLLTSVAACPSVDVSTRLAGTDALVAAAAAETQGDRDTALALLRELHSADASFPGVRNTFYSGLLAAGRAAVNADELDAARGFCSEAQSIRPEGAEAADCLAATLPTVTPLPSPTPTTVPTLTPVRSQPPPPPVQQAPVQPAPPPRVTEVKPAFVPPGG